MSHDPNGSTMVDAELLSHELRSGRDVVIVDVRSTAEFREGHIPGSRLVPIEQIVARSCELATHRSDPIVVASQDGARATIAAIALRLAGFDEIRVLEGGIARWRELGLPIERATTRSPLQRPSGP